MRYKHPKAQVHANGIYGGVGTRPADPFWVPGPDERSAPEEPVPARFRRLRLQRLRPRRLVTSEAEGFPWGLVFAAFLAVTTLGTVIRVVVGFF